MGKDIYKGKVIYLVCWPITQREVNNWGIAYLKNEGFDVEVYDLTLVLRKKAVLKNPVVSIITDSYIHEITSYEELISKLQEIPINTIFLDYIVSILDITFDTAKLFRILRKFSIRYCIVYSGTLPVAGNSNYSTPKLKRLIKKIKKIFDLHILLNFISGRINRYLVNFTNIYPLPDILFTTIESDAVCKYIENYPRMKNRLVSINAYDYDNYLKYIKTGSQVKLKEKTCVFIDEAATHHSDYYILGLKPLDKEAYFNSMNRLFDDIEIKTGLRVIVAAHPKSRYEDMSEAFKGREIIKGKTLELVSQSSMVIMHASTSASFAVLFKKPVMVVKTKEMIDKGWYAEWVDTMAEALGLVAVNIDDINLLNTLNFNYSEWNMANYNDYIKKYLMSEASAGFTTWEIVARELKNMLSNESC